MPKVEYQEFTLKNVSEGYRGICTTSPEEETHSRTLDPGEVVSVFLTEQEKRDLLKTGDFKEVDAQIAPTASSDQPSGAGEKSWASEDEVRAAIMMLDPADDAHWTKDGLPSVEGVHAMLGTHVSRASIEAAAPDAKRPQSD